MTPRLQQLQTLLESSPHESFLLFAVAKEYEGAGDTDQALAFYLRLQATDPQYVGLYYHLGKLYEQKDDPQNAIVSYKQGIAIARQAQDLHALSELNGALLNLEDPE